MSARPAPLFQSGSPGFQSASCTVNSWPTPMVVLGIAVVAQHAFGGCAEVVACLIRKEDGKGAVQAVVRGDWRAIGGIEIDGEIGALAEGDGIAPLAGCVGIEMGPPDLPCVAALIENLVGGRWISGDVDNGAGAVTSRARTIRVSWSRDWALAPDPQNSRRIRARPMDGVRGMAGSMDWKGSNWYKLKPCLVTLGGRKRLFLISPAGAFARSADRSRRRSTSRSRATENREVV